MRDKLPFQACAEASGATPLRSESACESSRGRLHRQKQSLLRAHRPRTGVAACVATADCLLQQVRYPYNPLGDAGNGQKTPGRQKASRKCDVIIIQPPAKIRLGLRILARRQAFLAPRYKLKKFPRESCRRAVGELSTKCKIP